MYLFEENPILGNQSLLLSRVKPADYILTFINLLGDTVLPTDGNFTRLGSVTGILNTWKLMQRFRQDEEIEEYV